jgi:hypothetical protein
MKYTILKGYRVFEGDATGEPMDEPNEDQLYGWLRTRGVSDEEASELIQKVDQEGSATAELPK